MRSQNILLKKNLNILGIIYVFALIIFGAIVNYLTWGPDNDFTTTFLLLLALITFLLYLPVIIFTQFSDWEVKEFGFAWNEKVLAIIVLIGIVFALWSIFSPSIWTLVNIQYDAIEAVARTGEELFFRGFIFALLIRVLANNDKSFLWTIFLSSLAFALVHTQTFLPGNSTTMFQVFLIALVMVILRAWSGSILPGIVLHLLFNTHGLVSITLSLIIYSLFVFWSYRRCEV